MKINNFRGDLTDISAKKEALFTTGTFVVADMPRRSPRNSFIFIVRVNIYRFILSTPRASEKDLLANNQ